MNPTAFQAMTISDLISLCLLFAAILAAVYARLSASQARRANEISLHNERLKIFRGLLDFRAEITAHGDQFEHAKLADLYNHLQLTEFYYDRKLYEAFKGFFDLAWEIDVLRHKQKTIGKPKEEAELVQRIQALFESLEGNEKELEEEFRKRLRLVGT